MIKKTPRRRKPGAGRIEEGLVMETVWAYARRFRYVLWLAGLALLMGAVYGYTHRGAAYGRPGVMPPAVRAETLRRQDMMRRVALGGETVPKASVDISPKYAGRIAEVAADLGDRVSAGDVLIRQDTKDLALSIRQNAAGQEAAAADAVEARSLYGADIMRAESDYANALSAYERYQSLYDQGAVALQDRDDRYRAMMEARSALEGLRRQQMGENPAVVISKEAAAEKARYLVQALRQQEADMTITAPISGVVGYRQAEPGEWAGAGETLLTLVDRSLFYVDCPVAEQDIAVLREGMTLPVSIDSIGETVEGEIIYISPAMDSASRSYIVRLALAHPPASVRGGMFARTEVTAVQRKDALFVPKEAVGDDNGRKYIFLIDSEGKARKAYVELGLINDEDMEILSGAEEGSRVAVTNIARLRDGAAVEIESGAAE